MSATRSIHRAAIALVALVTWSCGGGTPTGDNGSSIAAVVVTPPSSSLALNSTLPLQAEVQDASGAAVSGTVVLWSVRDANIATVSENGVVTGKSLGTTQVAASAGGKSGIATITVQKTPVASVAVRPGSVQAVVGSRTQLTGTAADEAGNVLADRAIVWTSSNPAVATVDGTGTVVAVSAGSVTITGASEGKTATAGFTIVQGAVARVVVTPDAVTMVAGQSTTLAASARDANDAVIGGKTPVWSSSNTAVATVGSDGKVTAVAGGNATITATIDGVSGSSAVTVSNIAVKSVSVAPGTASVAIGGSSALTATVRDLNDAIVTGRVITWTSSNPAVATVSGSTNIGTVTGVSAGTATITATSEGQSGSSTITVTAGGVTVSPQALSVAPLESKTLTATVTDANGKVINNPSVTWSSDKPLIATVGASNGVVTGVAPGTAVITATSGGKSSTATVTVSLVPVGSVTVAPASSSLTLGQSVTLAATVKDANGTVLTGRTVTWSSNNPSVASVNASTGVVSAVGVGTASITATSESKSGSATITVADVPVASITITPTNPTVVQNKSITLTATLRDAAGNILTGRTVTWQLGNSTSTGPSVSVTGVLPGTQTVTASSGTQSASTVVTITQGAVFAVDVSFSPASVRKGQQSTATAKVTDADGLPLAGRTVTWSATAGSVSPASSVTAANGTATTTVTAGTPTAGTVVTATSGGKSKTATLAVTN